jgi:uncharacterized protein
LKIQESNFLSFRGVPERRGVKTINHQQQTINNKNKNMSLESKIMDHMKDAMRAKDSIALEALRAIKSAIILAKTEAGAAEGLTEDQEIKMLQRLVKMRKDSAEIFTNQNRPDLAEPELAQIAVIEKFLPAQLSEAEIEAIIQKIISETGASGIASMGKVMGLASAQIGGQAEGKVISGIVKKLLV